MSIFTDPDVLFIKEDVFKLLAPPISISSDNFIETYESGDPPEVTVRLSLTDVQVYRCSYSWESPHELVANHHLLGTVNWKQRGIIDAGHVYRELIIKGQKQRRKSFRKCKYCGETFGPEYLHNKTMCHSCAELHLNIVH